MAGNPGKVTQVYIGFVDILFGVVVGISFAQFVPITLEFKSFAAILAYSTVVASWVGFHKGFSSGSDDYRGPYRFVIDIILLYLYYYLINSFNDFPLMLVILPIIFGFYVLWELSRLIELHGPSEEGIDIIVDFVSPTELRFGIQTKSHFDISEENFSETVQSQILRSHKHGLSRVVDSLTVI